MSKRTEYVLAGLALVLYGLGRVTQALLWPLEALHRALGGDE